MSALLLSFLYLFMDSRKTDLGAGDLAVDFDGLTGLSPKSVDYSVTHKLHTDIYNDLTNYDFSEKTTKSSSEKLFCRQE